MERDLLPQKLHGDFPLASMDSPTTSTRVKPLVLAQNALNERREKCQPSSMRVGDGLKQWCFPTYLRYSGSGEIRKTSYGDASLAVTGYMATGGWLVV